MALPTPGVTAPNWGAQLNAEITAIQTAIARRGGQYSSPATALPNVTVTTVTLTTSSGDSDVITGGNIVIPTGAGGLWNISATWLSGTVDGARRFLDIASGGNTYRNGVLVNEDRTTTSITLALAAGDTVTISVYANGSSSPVSQTIVNAYRIGV